MLRTIIAEIKKLPTIITRQELINWYLENFEHRTGSKPNMTTGELIDLVKACGKKVEGKSKLAIHISEDEERKFATRSRADLGQKKVNANNKISQIQKEKR